MEETPWAAPTQQMYLIAGQTHEQFDLRTLRDRIRAGELTPADEVSIVGTDIWKRADQYAPLSRFFALAQKMAAAPAAAKVPAGGAPPETVRVGAALAYPFTSLTAIGFLIIAFATALNPLLSLPVSLLGMVFSLAIIRSSANGQTRAPDFDGVGGIGDWVLDLGRVIAVMLVSLWPFYAFLVLTFMGIRMFALGVVAILVMMAYYPACLIAVARTRSIKSALSIQGIFGLMSILGFDYIAALLMWLVLLFASVAAMMALTFATGPRLAQGLGSVAMMFVSFYAMHLLGWAVYRHREQLD